MRVAFLTTEYPTETFFAGGLASYLHRVARALVEHGHEAEVFTLSRRNERVWDGPVLVHGVGRRQPFQAMLSKIPYFGRDGGYAEVGLPSWNLAAALHRRHKEAPFDIAQASNYRACGLAAACMQTIPLVTRISSYEPLWRAMYRRPLDRRQYQIERAEMLQVNWSTAVYAPSSFLAQTVKAQEGIDLPVIEPPFKLDRPPPGLPPTCAELGPATYGLFFGSIGYLKGCDRLVNVLPALLDANPEMKFVFAGPFRMTENGIPFNRYIEQKLSRYVKTRVWVLPEQKQHQLFQIVENARFVVLPSRADNLPNACMEAMALGRVVIGSRSASFEQLIDNEINGFLVSGEDDAELSACIDRVWRMDTRERDRLGHRAACSLQRLKPEMAILPLVALFEEAIRRHGQRRKHSVLGRLKHVLKIRADDKVSPAMPESRKRSRI